MLTYKDGLRMGELKRWHENGQLRTIGKYDYGNQHGIWKYYKADGTLQDSLRYEYGELIEEK